VPCTVCVARCSVTMSTPLPTQRTSVLSHVARHGRRRYSVSSWSTWHLRQRPMPSQFDHAALLLHSHSLTHAWFQALRNVGVIRHEGNVRILWDALSVRVRHHGNWIHFAIGSNCSCWFCYIVVYDMQYPSAPVSSAKMKKAFGESQTLRAGCSN